MIFDLFILQHGITSHQQQRRKYHLEATDEVAPRKRLTSFKLALDLMAGIWAGREFRFEYIFHVDLESKYTDENVNFENFEKKFLKWEALPQNRKQVTTNILSKMSCFDIIVRSTLSA